MISAYEGGVGHVYSQSRGRGRRNIFWGSAPDPDTFPPPNKISWRRHFDGGGEVAAKKVKVVEKKFECRYCENTYAKRYSRDLHQRPTREGDVIRATPIEFIGGGGEQRRAHFQQVRNILSGQRPEKPEKDDKAKKSIVIYKFKNNNNPANIRQLPNINTQLQEIKEKFINAILDESQQHSQGIKYMTVME